MLLAKKLKMLREDIKKWNINVCGRLEGRRKYLLTEPEALDHQSRSSMLDAKMMCGRNEILKQFDGRLQG